MIIFLIGPGGVGKSTSGTILANLLGYDFVDLDIEFCNRIANIGDYIGTNGYEKYCLENSKLFFKLLEKNKSKDMVFVLSSGFLVYEKSDLVKKHKAALQKFGVTILLLPSRSAEKSTKIVVERQMSRITEGIRLKREREEEKFRKRFPLYLKTGDIQIFSCAKPEIIAKQMKERVASYIRVN